MWSLQLPLQWGKSCPRHCPHSPPQLPPDPGSCCRCWWHQENKAPSSSKPTQRHLEFRAPNSRHRPPFRGASQSTSPEISSQLQKPGTHWGSSSPSLRLPELSPLHCCLSSHSSRHCQSLLPQLIRAPHLQNPVRTTLAPVAAPAPGWPGLPAGCQSALTLPCLQLMLVFLSRAFFKDS